MHVNDLEQAKKIIYSIDLQFVIDRLVKIDKWQKSEAEQAVQQYRNYLYLLKKYADRNLPPSKDIDEVWHAHILYTREYRKFCEQVFGDRENKFLDHAPELEQVESQNSDSVNNLEKLFEMTQSLYFQEFGEFIHQVRGLSFLRKTWEKIGEKLFSDEKVNTVY